MEESERKLMLKTLAERIRTERRLWNNRLDRAIKGNVYEYNIEDLMRLVGTLEAAYNHALAAIKGDGDIYCILKHLSYAVILIGEMDEPDVENIYDMMAMLTGGKIEACAACKREEEENDQDNNE